MYFLYTCDMQVMQNSESKKSLHLCNNLYFTLYLKYSLLNSNFMIDNLKKYINASSKLKTKK